MSREFTSAEVRQLASDIKDLLDQCAEYMAAKRGTSKGYFEFATKGEVYNGGSLSELVVHDMDSSYDEPRYPVKIPLSIFDNWALEMKKAKEEYEKHNQRTLEQIEKRDRENYERLKKKYEGIAE